MNYLKYAIILITVMFIASCASVRDGRYDEIKSKSETEKNRFISKIPPGKENDYGFADADEASKAVCGEPIRILALPEENERQDRIGEFVQTDSYRVPLIVDGDFKSLLTIENKSGAVKATDLGASELAREIGQLYKDLIKSYPSEQIYWLRVYSIKSDFLVINPEGDSKIFPAGYVVKSLKIETEFLTLSQLREIINRKGKK